LPVLRPSCFIAGERGSSSSWIRGWVGPGAYLDAMKKSKMSLPLLGIEPNSSAYNLYPVALPTAICQNRSLRIPRPTRSKKSRGSVGGIATGYGLVGGGVTVRVPIGSMMFTSPYCPDRLWGPPGRVYNGHSEDSDDLSSGVKRQGRESHHSPLTSAEVKKTWMYTSTPPYVLMA
jgi:hypothetical protein